jgi:predicted MFS family arabinose efflux permease
MPRGDAGTGASGTLSAMARPQQHPAGLVAAVPRSVLRRSRLAVSGLFIAHSVLFANLVPRVPAIKDRLGLSDGSLGLGLLGLGIGAVLALQLAGRLIGRFGSGPVARAGALAMCAALPPVALAPDLPALVVATVALGAAAGVLDAAMNAHGVVIERGYGRPIMSSFHALWSVAGAAGAVTGGLAARAGLGVAPHFLLAAVVIAGVALAAMRWLLPGALDAAPATRASASARSGAAGWSRPLLALSLIAFCSFCAEGTAADWSAVYLRDHLGSGAGSAAGGYAAFSLMMAAGRAVGDRLTARLGPVRLVRVGGLVAAAGFGLGLVLGHPLAAVAGFGLLGGGLACVVPVTFSAAGNLDVGKGGAVIARVVTLGYAGSLVGPPVIGFAAELAGLPAALGIAALLAAMIAACAGELAPVRGSRSGFPPAQQRP